MAFEKAKVLKAAEKFLSQGKINAAIKEYRQIVDHDTNDLTTLNMLGDLYARANKKEEAVSCFERIAQHYTTEEFNLKAIAMYKKIERLRPQDRDIARKLGDLYASQGLVHDARAQYLIVADAYTRAGDNKRTLEILHRIADLDPNNTEIRLKLADGYVKENMWREAVSAFVQAANRLHQTGSYDKALDAYDRALGLAPDDIDVLTGLLESHIALGTAAEAAEILEQAVEKNKADVRLASMLARAHLEAEDPKGAERATALMMRHDPGNYVQHLPVARLYVKSGAVDDTVRILGDIIDRMLAGRQEKELLELVNQVLEKNPNHIAALRMLIRIYWWQRNMESLRFALERLADSAQAAELPDEERYALTQLVRLSPDDQRYLERLNVLGGAQEETAEDLHPIAEEVPQFETGDVPQFETFANFDSTESSVTESGVAELGSVESTESVPTFSDPSASFADLGDNASEPTAGFQMVDFGDVPGVQVEAEKHEASDEPDHANLMMRQELESVDFYIAQGYNDIAIDTLDMLERQFGKHADITARRQKINVAHGAEVEAPSVFEFEGPGGVSADAATADEDAISFATVTEDGHGPTPSKKRPVAHGIDSGLAELFEEFRAAEEEEVEHADYETHYNMGTAYKEMDLLDDAIQEFQTAAAAVKPGDGTSRYLQCCNMLGHCFMRKKLLDAAIMWFKKGLAAPGHSEDEYQALRYELAEAYEQQGRVKEAQKLYTEIYGIDVSYREVAEKLKELSSKKKAK
ncbi:MAG TPA: tetratricopeptide repeat protein [Pyrinomonadaceae bacterium]